MALGTERSPSSRLYWGFPTISRQVCIFGNSDVYRSSHVTDVLTSISNLIKHSSSKGNIHRLLQNFDLTTNYAIGIIHQGLSTTHTQILKNPTTRPIMNTEAERKARREERRRQQAAAATAAAASESASNAAVSTSSSYDTGSSSYGGSSSCDTGSSSYGGSSSCDNSSG
ncbi:hypothetical protein PENVUL_c030G09762 [Penicillium vulpinum]|uniref:Uncharacterized protein n=2 Tax=Penicillium vulpinum TaxID=29845 RepID=A0A1V6RSX6_9EURO|nr:hypothetical protein PENVUL_c030G09762 [Penicillium vulpinum]